jgi:hypothetical protein
VVAEHVEQTAEQIVRAAIQMKNQKLQRSTSPKLVVIESMVIPCVVEDQGVGTPERRSP